MNSLSPIATATAVPVRLGALPPLPQAPSRSQSVSSCILAVAADLLPCLERGDRIDAYLLRNAMEVAFGASDAAGIWDWKTAYEACEVASLLFLRKYGKALFGKTVSSRVRLTALSKVTALLSTHTRRSEESQTFQQFSTPLPLGLAVIAAAKLTADDLVLEPSAGTGLLAMLAATTGSALALNELAETRADLLTALFPTIPVTRFDGAQIDDQLDQTISPSVILMNPPFSAMANVNGRMRDAGFRHIQSAFNRLAPGGCLVTITGANVGPDEPGWRNAIVRMQNQGTVVFSAPIAGSAFANHGTRFCRHKGFTNHLNSDSRLLLGGFLGSW